MANGRMTFRFDKEQDKSRQGPADYRPGRGLETAGQYLNREVQPEEELPLHTWPDRGPVVDMEEVHDDRGLYYAEPHIPSHEPSYSEEGYGGTYHTRRPSYWWKFALSVAGALATGVLLGYAALSMIQGGAAAGGNGADKAQSAVTGVQNGSSTGQPVAPDTGLPVVGADDAAAGQIPVDIAAQSYYLLQYGVFSTPDGADQARQELLGAGLAAGLDPEGGNRVYAGMSPDREQAKLLSSGLKSEGIELYVRELVLPGAGQASYAGQAEAVDSYFTASGQLLKELSGVSAALLSGSGQAAGSPSVSDLHMQWTEAVKALAPGLTPEGQSLCTDLQKAMNRGIAALNEYDKNKAQGLLWEVQESMMNFLAGQRNLLSMLTKG
ncbi:hypothetical protein C2I18_05675 [Paenibacillus sp. PK3_47]|uniref:SPOR domain-containing protein n=1 Tax=Paenibacillus sp. PK3_47 TaxID=2072642 RepID=UPI00201DC4F7|nr:SPOR domain-containing protein [Paenibacillus sp. PK3_47]UQZ33092.1 hypothetical protein C2I18_05675 [Paenibacillus sp. PK3_47]